MQMRQRTFALFLLGCASLWGQAASCDGATAVDKVDRAASYYHYGLARMYVDKALAMRGRTREDVAANRREYLNLAIENYKAAIKADPQMPMLSQELADLEAGRPYRGWSPRM
jgi:hypothetical protein